MSGIELRGVTKVFAGGIAALETVDLEVGRGERLVVLGPSGSGKTTLLRLIAGLETPDSGQIRIEGRDMRGLPPHRRDVAMVFQNPALYPHLSVFSNMAFGLRARGVARSDRRKKVEEVAERLGLGGLLKRRPATLSGGERQRVALGRAFASRPAVMLLDEPFSSLDFPLRSALRSSLIDLHQNFECTLVHVTHDQGEALALGHRIAVVHRGHVVQHATPREIYDRPTHPFVASFVGSPPMNLIDCLMVREGPNIKIQLGDPDRRESHVVKGEMPGLPFVREGETLHVLLGIRPEAVLAKECANPQNPPQSLIQLDARILGLEFQGDSITATFDATGLKLVARISTSASLREGQSATLVLDLTRASWFESGSGRILSDARTVRD